jgi:tRNA A37 methylthiotransferase MiaB
VAGTTSIAKGIAPQGTHRGSDAEPLRDGKAATRVYIAVNGCPENRMDAALVQRYLGSTLHFVAAANVDEADVIIVQGCSVTRHMENETRDIITHLEQAKHPESKLIVRGCIARFRPELAANNADTSIPLGELDHLTYDLDENARSFAVNHLGSAPEDLRTYLSERKQEVFANYAGQSHSKLHHLVFSTMLSYKGFVESRLDVCSGRAWLIKVSTGCLGQCSYCSVRLARGTVRSKTIDEVMNEFQKGLDAGYQNFVLLGTDIGDYGKDLGLDLVDLLREMVSMPKPFNLRLRNVNPRWVLARGRDFCEVAESGKIAYMQMAFQSGSDRILALMRRGHRAGEVMDMLGEIRKRAPRLVLCTQLIAGFPTETDADFKKSVGLVRSGLFDYTDVFRYTPRPGVLAADIRPEVPWDVIMRRYRTLLLEALVRHPVRIGLSARRMTSAPPDLAAGTSSWMTSGRARAT